MWAPQQQQRTDGDAVAALLAEARHALDAGAAERALQCVVEALRLLRGSEAVGPALRAAAEHFHAARSAPVDEISALLSQVSLAAAQQQEPPAPQAPQPQPWPPPQPGGAWPHAAPHVAGAPAAPGAGSILDETGRGEFADAALADGSSWCCPRCGGVVPQSRREAHASLWCPATAGGGGGGS